MSNCSMSEEIRAGLKPLSGVGEADVCSRSYSLCLRMWGRILNGTPAWGCLTHGEGSQLCPTAQPRRVVSVVSGSCEWTGGQRSSRRETRAIQVLQTLAGQLAGWPFVWYSA